MKQEGDRANPVRPLEGTAMYVACSTLCFSRLSLDEALSSIRDLHFTKVDLAIHDSGPHLRPADVAADVAKMAAKLKASNVTFAAFHLKFDHPDHPDVIEQLRAVCRLARLLTVPVITVPTSPLGADIHAEIQRLTAWAKVCSAEGVILSVETNRHALTANVDTAVELCEKVPGLGITLDPSHYLVGPNATDNIDPLMPYVRHIRLRDSGPTIEEFQTKIGQGMIEYGKIIHQAEKLKYDRALSVDIHDAPMPSYPIEPEVRKLKFLLESMV